MRIYIDETQGAASRWSAATTDDPVLVRMHALDPMLGLSSALARAAAVP
jgi:hypothetical protein